MKNIIIFIAIFFATAVSSQGIEYVEEAYSLNSGHFISKEVDDEKTPNDTKSLVFETTIKKKNTQNLRIVFGSYSLGEHSILRIESLDDGDIQTFTSKSLESYYGTTARFNGNAIKIQLWKSNFDTDIHFNIEQLIIGYKSNLADNRTLCGADDRVGSNDDRIARIQFDPVNSCTAWLVSNGAIVTAGHCLNPGANPELIEFDVQPSNGEFMPVNSAVEDQYIINTGSVTRIENGPGDDWAVFTVQPNSQTGLTPHEAQNDFFRVTEVFPNVNDDIRITGHGVDDGADWATQQTSLGPYVEENNGILIYATDTEGGNSGSPVIWEDNDFVIGVHSHGGCGAIAGNQGVSYTNNNFNDALNEYQGNNTVHVDNLSQDPGETGTVFAPYDSVQEGVDNVPSGGNLYIVTGTYTTSSLTINSNLTILPPAGGSFVITP